MVAANQPAKPGATLALLTTMQLLLSCPDCIPAEVVSRFRMTGHGNLRLDIPAPANVAFRLDASLAPAATQHPSQTGERFVLTGVLSMQSLVCYNDTVFRDDFDGDGL